jgi:hypothetical protein
MNCLQQKGNRMKVLISVYLASSLLACGGGPFSVAPPAADAGDGGAEQLGPDGALETADAIAPVLEHDAGELDARSSEAADAPVLEHDAGELDARSSEAGLPPAADAAADSAKPSCDPAYGDASPGGPCCVHVWATPTNGGVLCTVDGSRWCWQTGQPCSVAGSSCVVVNGVTYCAP